ncbi:MAG: hypothetical protein JWP02_1509 [Acidimicrobiales bacterium]|nr:hypothetical protein [Acidimicrobiales bacterium]
MTGWESIDAALQLLGLKVGPPTPGQTTGGGHVSNSEHYQGRARDYGTADSDAAGIAQALLPYAQGPDAPVDELFFSPLNIFYKNGQAITPDDALRQEHYSHVHVGIRANLDLAAFIGAAKGALGGSGASATLTGGIPGSGILGSALGFDSLKKIGLTAVFVAGGVGLLVLGGIRATHRSSG